MVHYSLSLVLIAISLFLFIIFVKCRPFAEVGCGVRLTAVQMPITRKSQAWDFLFSFRSSRCGKSRSRLLVDLALVCCSLDDQKAYSMYSTVQNAVYSVDYGHINSLDLARESKTF